MNNDILNRRRDNVNYKNIVASRPRALGRHYQLSPQSPSLAMEFSGEPYVDRQSMSARAIISTATLDRVGDVLIPSGCQTTNFVKNPVVLWAHGLEGIGQPIGTSRAPDGSLAVTMSEDEVQATSWFSQTLLEASQIFELIDEGIVRATSVRETPIKSHIQRDPEFGDILVVDEWDLEEWSWCAVGVNPDAVAKTLHRNRLGGQPIIPSIFKSLTAVAPTPRRFGVGLTTETKVTDTIPPNASLNNESTEDLTSNWDDDDVDSSTQPYGSTVISAVHASLTSAYQNIIDAMAPLENPEVKEGLNAILNSLQEQITALEGLHTTSYPNQPDLKADSENEEEDEKSMKAFLASGQVVSLRVLGLGSRLKGLIAAPNLTSLQRQTVKSVTQQLTRMVSQSKSRQIEDDDAKIIALQKSIRELTGLVAGMKK